jgi:hypothetical protein
MMFNNHVEPTALKQGLWGPSSLSSSAAAHLGHSSCCDASRIKT